MYPPHNKDYGIILNSPEIGRFGFYYAGDVQVF
ncbi:MAG: hypothetical protein UY23_C0001G0254 [Candidatus Jorgensenbacteria bacterium GW2011_GWA1_48_11]|uniref:Uncharacterized protein n=1 Tax=Candidatus Jorgensenbacteria bacterium GW2011_GWA1_48_11 TaxID=1618660 RepID=A0A0G1WMU6_9BACT|nr:MAG: hypothetical protein UY23_C0001G0254 [Candidatus Jorgensenbacteria bacterium GW2011_GWA1_48_11]KKW12140.1 MAG: hypothetical protein UY51_C0005G0382 [Candidatus Jorgensenbacteria bacterium GW2011_GWB1_49_9]